MPINNYHVGLAAYPFLLIRGLRRSNVPVQEIIDRSLMKNFILANPKNYIPLHVIYNFFEVASKYFKDGIIPEKCLQYFKFLNFGLIDINFNASSRLLDLILNLSKYDKFLSTNQNVRFTISALETTITNEFTDKHDRLGKTIMQELWLFMLLNEIIKNNEYMAHVLEVHLPKKRPCMGPSFFLNFADIISMDRNDVCIRMKTSSLSALLFNANEPKVTEEKLTGPQTGLVSKIEILLENKYENNLPSLNLMAACFNVSASTFKRHLKEETMSYNEIVEQWRFKKALHLLISTKLKINIIGEQLYYANTANFSRAFKRWSGLTPKEFRKKNH